jgi:hypothetical protein
LTDEEAEPLTNNNHYAPPRSNDDTSSSFKKWSFRLGAIAIAAMAGYAAVQASISDASVRNAAVLSHGHHPEPKGKEEPKQKHLSGKAEKDMKVAGKAEKEKSSDDELFDEERE